MPFLKISDQVLYAESLLKPIMHQSKTQNDLCRGNKLSCIDMSWVKERERKNRVEKQEWRTKRKVALLRYTKNSQWLD